MNFKLITSVTVGAFTYFVYLVAGGSVPQQRQFLEDRGITAPTHVMTCPTRIDPGCFGAIRDAGFDIRLYERLSFPVWMRTDAGAGTRDVVLPPMRTGQVRDCIEVVDWEDCTMTTAAANPTVRDLWGNALPFSRAGVTRKCVRRKEDAGLPCRRLQPDGGGPYNFGDMNVFPRSQAAAPAQCDTCECVVWAGDQPESDL